MAAASPISLKRLAANRANALKSTGPRSNAGKRRVAQNACKHHLYARKFDLPDAWEQHALRQAEEFCRDIADPELRPLMFHRVYLRGRMQYYNRLAIAFFKSIDKYGIPWFLANATYLNALHRYHAHIAAQIRRASRLLRAYQNRTRQEADAFSGPGRSNPLAMAAGQGSGGPADGAALPAPHPGRSNPSVQAAWQTPAGSSGASTPLQNALRPNKPTSFDSS